MLTADLVRARRRKDELRLQPLRPDQRARAIDFAAAYVRAALDGVGGTRRDLEQAFAAIEVGARDRRIADGLRKLVEDRCELAIEEGLDAPGLRRNVFERAAAARRAGSLDRHALLSRVAAEEGVEDAAELERRMYGDLKHAHRLTAFDAVAPEALVDLYELAQAQAVLLRAVRVVVDVRCSSAATYRSLFHKLKFHRLLHTIERHGDGYRVRIDGPLSLFRSTTKYGLGLALVLPTLRACDRFALEAEVRWGKSRAPLRFELEGGAQAGAEAPPPALREEVASLLERFSRRRSAWSVAPASTVVSLPGVGQCVPDLTFDHEDGARVHLEVLGFWSREAVFRRVDLAMAGLPEPVLFALSSRLRVSEDVLPDSLPAGLYVFKGSMSPKAVEERLEALRGRVGKPL